MSLADVFYQGDALRMIHRALSGRRVPHAYLFHGPDGVGKETIALGLAELLLCPDPRTHTLDAAAAETVGLDQVQAGCGKCDDCRCVAAGTHPDLHLIHRHLNREHPNETVRRRKGLEMGVDVVRHFLIDKVGMKPFRGRAKVFIVREADRITHAAQNAMLKTLEEPPGTTYLVLLVSSLTELLPTTLSRCQLVSFRPLPTTFVEEKLAAHVPAASQEQRRWYARLADGSLGRALELAADEVYERNERLASIFQQLTGERNGHDSLPVEQIAKTWLDEAASLGGRHAKRDPDITPTESTRRGLKTVFQLSALWYADLLRLSGGYEEGVVNGEHRAALTKAQESTPPLAAVDAIRRIAQAEGQLDQNVHVQLCVESLVSDLARGTKMAV